MGDDGVGYETRTVRAIRGTESRTVSKWAKAGWEVVSQSQGKLQTEITIRRHKPKTPWRLYAIGGGVVAVLIIALIVNGIIRERSSTEPAETSAEFANQTKRYTLLRADARPVGPSRGRRPHY